MTSKHIQPEKIKKYLYLYTEGKGNAIFSLFTDNIDNYLCAMNIIPKLLFRCNKFKYNIDNKKKKYNSQYK